MQVKPGDKVRTVHGSPGVRGVVVRQAQNSDLDGGERWLVRWTFPDGTVKESRWMPEALVPLDTPRDQDPPIVLVGTAPDGTRRTWLTRKGIMWTPATTTLDEMLLADALAFDVIYANREDR